jgi:small-conductance mechanosensitive channel
VANSFALRVRGLARYALILMALGVVMPAVPLNPVATDVAHKVFIAAMILLIGWVALVAAHMSADHYMGQFQLDTADNLLARKTLTQVRMFKRIFDILIVTITVGFALMTFDTVRNIGVSLFASAGVAGLVAGFAARAVFANVFAGLQLAITQPIRLGDTVVVENEFGTIEEFNSSYVVIKLWDLRRMVVPLSYFMEKPFQNWTRSSTQILGSVAFHLDYTAPIQRLRERATEIVTRSKLWDRRFVTVQVNDTKQESFELRVTVSAANADKLSDLKAELREQMIVFLQEECPSAFPRRHTENYTAPDIKEGRGEAKGSEMTPPGPH